MDMATVKAAGRATYRAKGIETVTTSTRRIQIDMLKEAQKYTPIGEQIEWAQNYQPYQDNPDRTTDIAAYLMNAGYIAPLLRDENGFAKGGEGWSGITIMGEQHLSHLEHPTMDGLTRNWFPVLIAVVNSGVGIASIVINIFKR